MESKSCLPDSPWLTGGTPQKCIIPRTLSDTYCVPAAHSNCRFETEEASLPLGDEALRIDSKIIPEIGKGKKNGYARSQCIAAG